MTHAPRRALVALLPALALALAAVVLAPAPAGAVPAGRGPDLGFVKIDGGGEYTCGIKAEGTLWCWGRNTWGQIGDGTRTASVPRPTQVGSATDWAQVSAGGATTCAVRTSGELWCWGLNNKGQLGDGTTQSRFTPQRVPGEDWKRVSAGWFNVCATRSDGSAYCWGDNAFGQLGRGNTQQTRARVRLDGSGWKSVSVGGQYVCGTKTDGALLCWGRNVLGQVGDGTWTMRSRPTKVASDRSWAQVSTSWTHTCARTRGGAAYCWGRNTRGAIGDGTNVSRNRPTPVGGDHTARSITAYEGGSCLVDRARRTWCWGDNLYGQVGGGAVAVLRPRLRAEGFRKVSGGWLHVCGVRTEGRGATCWGNNERDELGGRVPRVPIRTGPDPAYVPSGNAEASSRSGGFQYRLATFNVLGEHHSGPYRDADRFGPSRMRAEWTAQAILNNGMEVIGIQEPSEGQVTAIQRASGGRLGAYPTAGDHLSTETTLLWDKSRFEAVRKTVIRTQFIQRKLPRPLVLLRDKQTGRTFWVLAVHNAPNTYQHQRDLAVAAQVRRIQQLEQGSDPVFFVGDMNEKQTVLCKVLRGTDLVSPAGGRLTADGRCVPPQRTMRVDWLFGPSTAAYSGFAYSRPPLVALSTDHYVPVADVRVP